MSRKDNRKRLERTGISIPTILVENIDKRAQSLGMSRSHYVTHILANEERTQLLERLERAERRIKEIEAALQPHSTVSYAMPAPPPLIRASLVGQGKGDNGTAFVFIPRFIEQGQDMVPNPEWLIAPFESEDGGKTFTDRYPTPSYPNNHGNWADISKL